MEINYGLVMGIYTYIPIMKSFLRLYLIVNYNAVNYLSCQFPLSLRLPSEDQGNVLSKEGVRKLTETFTPSFFQKQMSRKQKGESAAALNLLDFEGGDRRTGAVRKDASPGLCCRQFAFLMRVGLLEGS